jgi:hypothetical protein
MNALAPLRRAGLPRRIVGLFGMLAIVLQLGVALAHEPAESWLGAAMCHAGGGNPAAPADKKSALCPVCLGLQANGAALVPPLPGIIALDCVPAAMPLPPSRVVAQGGHDPGSPAQPRAPPVSI